MRPPAVRRDSTLTPTLSLARERGPCLAPVRAEPVEVRTNGSFLPALPSADLPSPPSTVLRACFDKLRTSGNIACAQAESLEAYPRILVEDMGIPNPRVCGFSRVGLCEPAGAYFTTTLTR